MTRRKTILIIAVAFIAAAGAYWTQIISPKREEAAAISTKITAQETALAQADAQLATYEAARGSYRANYTKVARLGKAVPADDDVRSLMVQLNAAADRTKVDFRMINVDGSEGSPAAGTGGTDAPAAGTPTPPPGSSTVGTAGFSTMPFSFQFQGSFNGLGKFFERLDRFVKVRNQGLDVTGRLLLLNSITLKPDELQGFPLITAEVKANSYLLPAAQGLLAGASADGPTAAAAGAAPAPAGSSTSPATTTAVVSGAPE